MTATTDLDRTSTGYEALAPEVRERWAVEQVQTIRKTVAKDLSIPEFQMGMALAAKYDLDPLLHEIWFAKDINNDRPMIMTGRDGFLTIARRQEIYGGMAHDVVREEDEFSVEWENGIPNVRHKYKGDDDARGKIKGAWAVAYFEGKKPTYFYAPLSEYMPTNPRKVQYSPWGSQLSVMMLKCAQSYVLRIGSGVTGLVGAEESERALERRTGVAEGTGEVRGVQLPAEVEAVIERAEGLGHQRHAERSVWEFLADRGPDAVATAVSEATVELDELGKIQDAEVEPDVPIDDEDLPPIPPEVVEEVRRQWPSETTPFTNVGEASKKAAEKEAKVAAAATETPPEATPGPQPEPEVDVEKIRRQLAAAQKKKPKTDDEKFQLQAEIEWCEEELMKAAEKEADENESQGRLV